MPPPTGQRRNTVYDLAALRIHHDSFRIPSSDSNYSYLRDKKIARDVRGNWIANDAGGTGRVPWYKKVEDDEGGEEGEGTQTEGDEEGGSEKDKENEDEGEEDEEESEEYRKGQRRRFYEDMSYLESKTQASQPPGSMLVPDSDLLKTIHYFASVYYNEMGQLYDSKRLLKQIRKQRQERRSDIPPSDEEVEDENAEAGDKEEMEELQKESDEHEWTDEDDGEDEDLRPRKRRATNKGKAKARDPSTSVTRKRRKLKKKRNGADRDWDEVYRNQNMYRRFDGSALICLGMLLQEYVKDNVRLPVRNHKSLQTQTRTDLPNGQAAREDVEEGSDSSDEEYEGSETPVDVGNESESDEDSE